jgi:hypothetical protein
MSDVHTHRHRRRNITRGTVNIVECIF